MIKAYCFSCMRYNKFGKIPISDVRALRLGNKQTFLYELKFGVIQFSCYRNSVAQYKARFITVKGFMHYLEHQNLGKMSEFHINNNRKPGSFIGYQRNGRDFSSFGQRRSVCQSGMIPDLTRQIHKWSPKLGNKSNVYEDGVFNQKIRKKAKYDSNISNNGDWTLNNSKAQLHLFLQRNNIEADYKYFVQGPDHCKTFVAEMTIFLPNLNRTISGSGTASSKVLASKSCAYSLVQQLYALGVIGGLRKKSKQSKDKLQNKSFPVAVSPQLEKEINEVLSSFDIEPVKIPSKKLISEDQATSSFNLVIPETLTSTNLQPLRMVSWSPPIISWHTWNGCEIPQDQMSETSLDEMSWGLQESFCRSLQENEYFKAKLQERQQLPIAAQKEEILKTISNNSVVIICGSTGCGKTTQVCQFILDDYIQSGKGAHCNVVVSQPRRIGATSVSERVAFERGESLGKSVGYGIRFKSCPPRPFGSIFFCTVGVLIKKLEDGLQGVSHIIVDEIHERGFQTDFLLIILRDMVKMYPDLRLILMSATVNTALFSKYFGNCPIINVSGRVFPVERYFLEDCIQMTGFNPAAEKKRTKAKSAFIDMESDDEFEGEDKVEKNLNNVISNEYLPETKTIMSRMSEKEINFELIKELIIYCKKLSIPGAILIFLPGWNLIFTLMQYLQHQPLFNNFVFLPLHSNLSEEDKEKVFSVYPDNVTKVILATNIAETSITVNDVVFVIDSCKIKIKSFSSHNNLDLFCTVWASKSNLQQRSGRAGRVRPGMCFHLCSKARYQQLEEQITPEIMRMPLHMLVLSVKLLELGSAREFFAKALEPPPMDAVIEAEKLLRELKCLDSNNELTEIGRILSKLPVEPKFGKILILSCIFDCADALATIAGKSSLSSDVFIQSFQDGLTSQQKAFAGNRFSDHVAALNAFQAWRRAETSGVDAQRIFCNTELLSPYTLKEMWNARNQLIELLANDIGFSLDLLVPQTYNFNGADSKLDMLVALLVMGFNPNIAYHTSKRKLLTQDKKFALINKSSVNCSKNNEVFPSPFFVYEEKVSTEIVTCKNMTMVTPIHLLLFGTQCVEFKKNKVILDDWINLDMKLELASAIVALRSALDDLLYKAAANPKWVTEKSPKEEKLINVIKQLCQLNAGQYNMHF